MLLLHGSYDSMEELLKIIKENNLESKIDVKATFCFENCGISPNISVNGKIITDASPDNIKKLFDEHINPAAKV